MKKIRPRHVVASLMLFGMLGVSGLTASSMAAPGTSMPAGTDVTPSSAYVAPTPASIALGKLNISHFRQIVKQGLNEGHLSIIDKYISPTVVDHQYYGPGYPRSRGGIKALTAALRTAFPDLHATATTLVASNNGTQTFAIIRTTGTNTGRYLGLPPTHRKIVLNILESALWKDGVIVEHWGVSDNISLLADMGLFPLDKFPAFSVKDLAKKFQEQWAHPPKLHHRTAPTPEDKLAAVRRLIDVGVNQADMFAPVEIAAPNYVDHEFYGRNWPSNPQINKNKAIIAVNATALPDIKTHVREVQVIGPAVFTIMYSTGTNTGKYLGLPATGRKIDIDVFDYWHFNSKGQVDEHDGIADLLGLVAQLGFVPPGSVPVYSPSKVAKQFLPELKKG